MHIQIVRFNLKDLSHADYLHLCDELAPTFADVPGLVSKTWLADEISNTYGGVYFWNDAEAMAEYYKSDLCKAVIAHPNLTNLTSQNFDELVGPSSVTNSLGKFAA